MDKKKILIVDDEEVFLQITKINIEDAGQYEVMGLINAKEIVPTVHQFKPDVILLDLVMPGMGGLDVCELLNRDAVGKSIPIIILSALDKSVDKLKAFKLGVVGYLVKPASTDQLIISIERALEYKKA